MREHLSGVTRMKTDPTDPPPVFPSDRLNPRRCWSVGGSWVGPEPEARLLARFAAIDFPLSKSRDEASQ
jgi:hypothetical protein